MSAIDSFILLQACTGSTEHVMLSMYENARECFAAHRVRMLVCVSHSLMPLVHACRASSSDAHLAWLHAVSRLLPLLASTGRLSNHALGDAVAFCLDTAQSSVDGLLEFTSSDGALLCQQPWGLKSLQLWHFWSVLLSTQMLLRTLQCRRAAKATPPKALEALLPGPQTPAPANIGAKTGSKAGRATGAGTAGEGVMPTVAAVKQCNEALSLMRAWLGRMTSGGVAQCPQIVAAQVTDNLVACVLILLRHMPQSGAITSAAPGADDITREVAAEVLQTDMLLSSTLQQVCSTCVRACVCVQYAVIMTMIPVLYVSLAIRTFCGNGPCGPIGF